MNELAKRLRPRTPKTAIILGSSLGAVADAVKDPLVIPYGELAGLSGAEDLGPCRQAGRGQAGRQARSPCCAGRAHPYETGNAAVMRPAIETLKDAGIETLILTNAAGSLEARDAARLASC